VARIALDGEGLSNCEMMVAVIAALSTWCQFDTSLSAHLWRNADFAQW